MSFAKRQAAQQTDIFHIGDDNSYIGKRVRCTWLRAWGKRKKGYAVTGELRHVFSVHGRTLIGQVYGMSDEDDILNRERMYTCPWSRNFLQVQLVK